MSGCKMKLAFVIAEDFINYKKTSMTIGFPYCSMKCNIDQGREVCQNTSLCGRSPLDLTVDTICERYKDNDISQAIVFQGMEPFDSPFDLISIIDAFRTKYEIEDDIVIYTGYTEDECNGIFNTDKYPDVNFSKVQAAYNQIKNFKNIIVKFGRYIPGDQSHFDEVLGVNLASSNQYAKVVSSEEKNI